MKKLHSHINSLGMKVENVKATLASQIDGQLNRRLYPALWTIECKQESSLLTSTFVLKMRSHLSDKCFHDPIEVTVANELFGKYGIVIKVRTALTSGVSW